jgi:GntR family transcriptional regulator, transcriptional repressor for pyruvate dehydrogenase complex
MTSRNMRSESRPFDGVAAELVVAHIRALIDQGQLKPGDRLPAERELAVQIGVSRPSVRAGLRALAAMGVVQSRHGAGTFIRSGPPVLGSEPLSFLAALHGFTRDEMFEARRVLEVGVAGLAAERATGEHLASIAEEITGMYASLEEPLAFLRHDIRFHRAIAAASGNPILASLVEMVSALFYEQRRKTAGRAHDLRESAEMHRSIYNALRMRDAERSRLTMNEHLTQAQDRQALEEASDDEAAAPSDPRTLDIDAFGGLRDDDLHPRPAPVRAASVRAGGAFGGATPARRSGLTRPPAGGGAGGGLR